MATCVQKQLKSVCTQFDASWSCIAYQNQDVYLIQTENILDVSLCNDQVTFTQAQLDSYINEQLNFNNLGITPENILLVLSWGMGYILLMWSLGYSVGIAKKLINKI